MIDWVTVFKQVHDTLIPKLGLDPWERAVYQYLLRHSRLNGKEDAVISIDGVAAGTGFSSSKVRDSIRSMHKKGCLAVDDRSRKGHVIRVHLPSEINGLILQAPETTASIETIDFYTDRKHLPRLLKREDNRCFYCLHTVTEESCVLDHVIPQVLGGANSYKNIVVACHQCNSMKQGALAEDFLRALYREGTLSKSELKERLEILGRLQEGALLPNL